MGNRSNKPEKKSKESEVKMGLQKESERRGWPPASMIDQTVGGVENNTRAGAETSFFKFHTICSQNPCSVSIIRKSYIILMHAKKKRF